MPKYNITLSLETIGTLDEGGLLEEIMQQYISRIVEGGHTEHLDVQVYEARCLVALADLLDAIKYSNRKAARIHEV